MTTTTGRAPEGRPKAAAERQLAQIHAALELAWAAGEDLTSDEPAWAAFVGDLTPTNLLEHVALQAAEPLVASAAWTLESNGGSAWEPIRPPHGAEAAVWRDLRPSEAMRLVGLVEAARDRSVARCKAAILEELTNAAAAFVAEYPDAPRAWQVIAGAVPEATA